MTTPTKDADPKEGLVTLRMNVPTDPRERALLFSGLLTEIAVISGIAAGRELRQAAKLAAAKNRTLDSWAAHRPAVRNLGAVFTASVVEGLCEGDPELSAEAARFPLESELFEVTEARMISPNGQTFTTVTRRPKPRAAAPITLSIPGVPR